MVVTADPRRRSTSKQTSSTESPLSGPSRWGAVNSRAAGNLPFVRRYRRQSCRGILAVRHRIERPTMRRRELMLLLGGAAISWPRALRAQQKAMPVIGYLGTTFPGPASSTLAAFRQGLSETGYV